MHTKMDTKRHSAQHSYKSKKLESFCPTVVEYVVPEVKNPPANAGDGRCGVSPWVGKILRRRAWQPTPVFLPGESMDRGAWRATVYSVPKSQTQPKRLNTDTS